MRITTVNRPLRPEQIVSLTDLLIACIREGAVLGYMSDTTTETAAHYWREVSKASCAGRTATFIAESDSGAVVGTAQVSVHFPPNQSHAASLHMLMVHPEHRRRGIVRQIMSGVEEFCHKMDRSILILETAGGDAGCLYMSLGFVVVGIIPDLWRTPAGDLANGYVFQKRV